MVLLREEVTEIDRIVPPDLQVIWNSILKLSVVSQRTLTIQWVQKVSQVCARQYKSKNHI